MKRAFLAAAALFVLLPLATACGKYDYGKHVSETRSDIFTAETEEFSVTLSCITREHPYVSDGIVAPLSDTAEIVVRSPEHTGRTYSVLVLGETEWGGEMSFRNVQGDWFYSQGVTAFPEGSVSLRVSWEDGETEVVATSVKTDRTLSPDEALARAVGAEKELVGSMMRDGRFRGEFYVRLLRRDKNYYYVGIVNEKGETVSLLLDAESGEVLARRPKRQ